MNTPDISEVRRGAREVASRCVCMEMIAERVAYEGAENVSREELDEARKNLIDAGAFLGLEFTDIERKALETPIGGLAELEEEIATIFGDIPYLLWALGRISRLYSVDDLGPRLAEILGEGLMSSGDRHAIEKAMDDAELRAPADIDAMLFDIARANAFMAQSSGGPSSTMPPATAFYVLPWLRSNTWPWGAPCELMTDIDGVSITLAIDGVRPA